MAESPIIMPIQNGQIPTNQASEESKKTQAQANKDMFLQLLVAEMQYQDPLEPTDNSEYIQQLYSMSQTESILEVQEDVEEVTMKGLVGKYVTAADTKEGRYGEGKVDSVAKVDGSWKVSINGELFDAGMVTQVHDETYFVAVTAADTLTDLVNKLPKQEDLHPGHKDDLQKALDVYNSMDDYAKGFLKEDTVTKLESLVSRMNSLLKPKEEVPEEEITDEESTEPIEEETAPVEAEE